MRSRPQGWDVAADAKLTLKDFKSDQEVRWCPGCGDYAILAAVQAFMPELGIAAREHRVHLGHRLRGRFPYYMQTYGMHSIHGRAPAIATGLAVSRADLAVWVVTRRRRRAVDRRQSPDPRAAPQRQREDPDVQQPDLRADEGPVLADERPGQGDGVDPDGSVDYPFNPLALALGAGATFVARALDIDKPGLTKCCAVRRRTRRRVRRGLPELQHLQRRRVRVHPRGQGSAHVPRARQGVRVDGHHAR